MLFPIYDFLIETSIGKLFLAGILPGLVVLSVNLVEDGRLAETDVKGYAVYRPGYAVWVKQWRHHGLPHMRARNAWVEPVAQLVPGRKSEIGRTLEQQSGWCDEALIDTKPAVRWSPPAGAQIARPVSAQ